MLHHASLIGSRRSPLARRNGCWLIRLTIADQARAVLEALSSLAALLRTSDQQANARLRRRQLRASRFALPYLDCLFATRVVIWRAGSFILRFALILRSAAKKQTVDPSSSAICRLCSRPNCVEARALAEQASQHCDPERSHSRRSLGSRCGSAPASFESFQSRIRPITPCHAGTSLQTF